MDNQKKAVAVTLAEPIPLNDEEPDIGVGLEIYNILKKQFQIWEDNPAYRNVIPVMATNEIMRLVKDENEAAIELRCSDCPGKHLVR